MAALTRLIAPYEGDTPRFDHGEWRKLFPAPGFTPLSEKRIPHGHTGSPEHVIIDRTASISFIAALDDAERARLLARVRELIALRFDRWPAATSDLPLRDDGVSLHTPVTLAHRGSSSPRLSIGVMNVRRSPS